MIEFLKALFSSIFGNKSQSATTVTIPLEPKLNIPKEENKNMALPEGIKDLVTKQELLAVGDVPAPEHEANFEEYHTKINIFRNKTGIPMEPSSYYRSRERQIRIYKDLAARKLHPYPDGVFDESKIAWGSVHLLALAGDYGGKQANVIALKNWILVPENQAWCKENGYYFEDPAVTVDDAIAKGQNPWIHAQIRPPKSGNVVFKP